MTVHVRRLGDLATVFNGKTPSKAEQRDSGHPVLKIKDVSETGDFRGQFNSFVELPIAAKYSSRWIRSGDSLILNAAHNSDYVASKLFLAGKEVSGVLPTGEWLLIRPEPSHIIHQYLNYWLQSEGTRKQIRFLVKGIHLYPKDVAELLIPVPQIPEQHRLVDILSRAEGIVRLRREAQKKVQELIPALFLDMFGDPATNPRGWPIMPLLDVAEIISGVTKGRKIDLSESISLPYIRVANVQDGHLNLAEIKYIEVRPNEIEKYRLEPGDLLMTEGGDPDKLGRAALWNGEIEHCLHQNHVFKVRANRKLVFPEYLRALIGSEYGKRYFLQVAKQTTGIASINKNQLGCFPVVVPPLIQQIEFTDRVIQARSIQSQQSIALEKAEAVFQSLLHRAFAGQL